MTREPDLQPEHSGSLFENYKGFGKKERPNRKQGPLFFVRILLILKSAACYSTSSPGKETGNIR